MPRPTPARAIEPPALPETLPHSWIEPESFGDQSAFAQTLLSEIDLSDSITADVLFDRVLIRRGHFANIQWKLLQLLDVRMDGCDLASARWEKPHIQRAELLGCRLLGMTIQDAQCDNLLIQGCNAEAARFWASSFRGTRFEGCSLKAASFEGSNLGGAVFRGCNMSGCDLRRAKLKGADVRGCDLSGVQITPVEMKGLIVTPTQAAELAALFGLDIQPEEAAAARG